MFVFDGDVTAVEPAPDAGEDSPQDGDLVTVRDAKGRFLGTGFWNSRSRMRVRLVSRNANDTFTDAFWNRRLRYALDYRKSVMGEEDLAACRLIFSEADGLPGLIADRFEDVLSVQVLSLGAERRLDRLLPALVTILREDWGQVIRTVYLRCDGAVREREGLTRFTGCYTFPCGVRQRIPGRWRLPRTAFATQWTTARVRKPDFSLTRNTIAAPYAASRGGGACWTASRTPAPSG